MRDTTQDPLVRLGQGCYCEDEYPEDLDYCEGRGALVWPLLACAAVVVAACWWLFGR